MCKIPIVILLSVLYVLKINHDLSRGGDRTFFSRSLTIGFIKYLKSWLLDICKGDSWEHCGSRGKRLGLFSLNQGCILMADSSIWEVLLSSWLANLFTIFLDALIEQDMLDSTNSDPDFMNTIINGDESWVYGYHLEIQSFRHFPYNENPMIPLNATSLKCYLPSTDAIDGWEKIYACVNVQGRLIQVCFIELHQVFKKVWYFSNRVVYECFFCLQEKKPAFGLLFDIDGVIVRGKQVFPFAPQCFQKLIDPHGRFRIPTVFVTNAGNATRQQKAKQLSSWLAVEVSAEFSSYWLI